MASKVKDFLDLIKDIRGTTFNEDGTPKTGLWAEIKAWHTAIGIDKTTITAQVASATASASTAVTQATAASNSAIAAAISKTGADATIATIAASASAASSSSSSAGTSATTAANKAIEAANSAVIAKKWSNEAEDAAVFDGVNPSNFSAYHWAKKAEAAVTALAGVTTFLQLTDTPASYVGQVGKYLKVGATNNIEFDALTKDDVGLGFVDNTSDVNKPVSTATQTILDLKLEAGALLTSVITVPELNIDMLLSDYFTKTITANSTLTVSNAKPAGVVSYFLLELTNGGAFVTTWWSGIKWGYGVAPTLTPSGKDLLSFSSIDGGVTWVGNVVSKDFK